MTEAGKLDRRVTLERRVRVETPAGGWADEWRKVATVWAGVRYLRGTEAVMAARLASQNPVIVTVRKSQTTGQITSEWRVLIGGKPFEVHEDPRPSADGAVFEFLAVG